MNTTGNPFSEPDDDDQTMIVSREAISALSARKETLAAAPARDDEVRFDSIIREWTSPIIGPAGPILTLVARLNNTLSVPDSRALRERAGHEVELYGAALRQARLDPDTMRIAHYALCASLDDVVQSTPWGSHGSWTDLSLTSAFHRDVRGGERFFLILNKLLESPNRYIELIELMYLCMSLGMQGQYRLMQRGPAEWDKVREETYATIVRVRGRASSELSAHWVGLAEPYRPLRFQVPVWLVGLLGFAFATVSYALASFSAGSGIDILMVAADRLPPYTMPTLNRTAPVRAPPENHQSPGLRDRLVAALQPDIRNNALAITGSEPRPLIRLQAQGMFENGTATIRPQYIDILRRIGDTLGHNQGFTHIVGYTDSNPIRTIRFSSNYALSLARAQAAAAVIGPYVGYNRLVAEGRGAAAPVGDNATEAGRRANRRVEIAVFGEETP